MLILNTIPLVLNSLAYTKCSEAPACPVSRAVASNLTRGECNLGFYAILLGIPAFYLIPVTKCASPPSPPYV